MVIRNREQVVSELARMLFHFDKDRNQYQTDVYAYYDEETENVEIDTFINVGGNSWLNDNHITIYTDKEHYSDGNDIAFDTEDSLAEIIGKDLKELVNEVAESIDYDAEDVTYADVYYYIVGNEEYNQKLESAYIEWLTENIDYTAIAEQIIEERLEG